MKKLKIGITIGLQHVGETLWNNGIKQNAIFLAEALKNCPSVDSVKLINTTTIPITNQMPWDLVRWPTVSFEEGKDELDVLIELGGQIDSVQTEYIKHRGCRLVSYCCGFEYIHTMESILFSKPSFGFNLFINYRYDAIWVIPQVAPISGHYFSTWRRLPSQIVPFVWSPIFLENYVSNFDNQGIYQGSNRSKRLTIMEPNINVAKFCLYPIFIAEEAYRKRPDLVERLQVTNSERIAKESHEFIAIMNNMDIVRNHKAVFLGRQETPRFLSEMTDIVISHQWENALNYFYLEVAWQGFPLVHNAEMCREIGYYYPHNDVQAGCSRLIYVMEHHDADISGYTKNQRELIRRFLPDSIELVKNYDMLLQNLIKVEIR